uniref:Uncharacterized protein n=1 Tax=Cacopsylla melanoneura TaxID=428564 RepID=A0A8D8U0Y9_9HEMI
MHVKAHVVNVNRHVITKYATSNVSVVICVVINVNKTVVLSVSPVKPAVPTDVAIEHASFLAVSHVRFTVMMSALGSVNTKNVLVSVLIFVVDGDVTSLAEILYRVDMSVLATAVNHVLTSAVYVMRMKFKLNILVPKRKKTQDL